MKELYGAMPDAYFYVCLFDPKNGLFLEEHDYDDEPDSKFVLGLAEKFSDIIVVAGWNYLGDYRLIRRRNGKFVTDKVSY